jgi:hypothetical protein
MGGKFFRGLAFLALASLVFVTSCQAWWVGGEPAPVEAASQ